RRVDGRLRLVGVVGESAVPVRPAGLHPRPRHAAVGVLCVGAEVRRAVRDGRRPVGERARLNVDTGVGVMRVQRRSQHVVVPAHDVCVHPGARQHRAGERERLVGADECHQ
ncbi:MAG: hypothetical protein ACK56I_26150, partial [bacterium]